MLTFDVSIDLNSLSNLFHKQTTRSIKKLIFQIILSNGLDIKIVYVNVSSPIAVVNNFCTILVIIQVDITSLPLELTVINLLIMKYDMIVGIYNYVCSSESILSHIQCI